MEIAPLPASSAAVDRAFTRHDLPLHLRDGTVVWVRGSGGDAGALADGAERAVIVAVDAGGVTVGRTGYSRVYGPRATIEIEIDEGYWHRGLPELLVAGLCLRATRFGVSALLARVCAADLRQIALLRRQFAARETRDGAHVDIEVPAGIVRSGWTTDPDWLSSPMAHILAAPTLALITTSAPSSFAAGRVADVMHGPVITCGPETPIQVVADLMAHEHVHAIVVTGIELKAWGIVTALDIAAAAAANAVEDVARDVAATEPVVIDAGSSLPDAARVMLEHQVSHLLVTDADGRPAGIVSTSDIAACFGAAA